MFRAQFSYPLRKLIFPLSMLVLIGCTQVGDDTRDPDPSVSPNGMLYIDVIGDFMKLDPSKDSVYWRAPIPQYFNSSGNPMTFDSGYFYHGNHMSITCFRTSTGGVAWSHSWLAFSDAYTYREPAFKDSMVFFTYPTSAWDHGYLLCMNKKTGGLYWKIQIDSGGVYTSFNGVPVISGDKVVCMTRNANDQIVLKAFLAKTGQLVWATAPINASIRNKFWEKNGRIYTAYGNDAVCYDAATGQELWKTSIQDPSYHYSYNFLDNDKMVVVRVISNITYKVIQLSLASGTVIQSQQLILPSTYASFSQLIAPLGISYQNNKLYVAHYYSIDSLDIYAHDVNTLSQLWTKRFANHLLTGQAPVLSDKYLIFPINDKYNTPSQDTSKMIFLDLSGNLLKKIPYNTIYTDKLVYEENGVFYDQGKRF